MYLHSASLHRTGLRHTGRSQDFRLLGSEFDVDNERPIGTLTRYGRYSEAKE